MSNTIVITFDYDGTPEIEVNGVTGQSCAVLTKPLEDAFGVPSSETKKREYHENERKPGQRATLGAR